MTEVLSLRDRANAFTQDAVDAKITEIDVAVSIRDNAPEHFGISNGGLSWSNSRKLINKNKIALARFLLVLGIDARNVILDKAVESAYFNAKALKKVVDLARFTVTGSTAIEKVLVAFIMCSLRYTAIADGKAIANRHNKLFLSNISFADILKDEELADYVTAYQQKTISGGRDTQSSQARRVLEVLKLADIDNSERVRGGIALNSDHEFFELFTDAFIKDDAS